MLVSDFDAVGFLEMPNGFLAVFFSITKTQQGIVKVIEVLPRCVCPKILVEGRLDVSVMANSMSANEQVPHIVFVQRF